MARTDQQIAREAMALPGFAWLPGLLPIGWHDPKVYGKFPNAEIVYGPTWCRPSTRISEDHRVLLGAEGVVHFPDLSDAATGGVLLSLLQPTRGSVQVTINGGLYSIEHIDVGGVMPCKAHGAGSTLARACCLVAIEIGRWPGGAP